MKDLKEIINSELEIIEELNSFISESENSRDSKEKKIYEGLTKSLLRRIYLLNNKIPEAINSASPFKKIPKEPQKVKKSDSDILFDKKLKEEFLKELNISSELLKKLNKGKVKPEKKESGFKKPTLYARLSNKLFLNLSNKIIKSGNIENLLLDIRKSNMNILGSTYVSMAILTTLISFFLGIIIAILLLFIRISFEYPFISLFNGNYLIRAFQLILIPIGFGCLSLLSFYFYPAAEKRSLGKRIDQELPFMVIHMGSISGSGIKPFEIFKIIGTSSEYKYAGQEVRKLLNQTNIYGYDLSTALRNISHSTPSTKLSELFTGVSVTINSGGDIKKFFEKRAESLLLNYRLEREKATKKAETFMDLYISVVIATPMILLMILVMISVSGLQSGFNISQLSLAMVGIVSIVNIIFLTFLHLKQPQY